MTHYFKGFTNKGKRKNFLRFLESLKRNNIEFKKADVFKNEERFKVGDSVIYGKGDDIASLKYMVFRDDKSIPLSIVKKYTKEETYWSYVILSFIIISSVLSISFIAYDSYIWGYAPKFSGTIQDIKEHCYIGRGFFSAPNKVCETTHFKLNDEWYRNDESSVYEIGQQVEIKCIKNICR